ncbi:MAG: hypothetical protein D6E12_09755 [Desulfovibrio sp.]|nr:MAG: hypothetical protein D6E12_09755 [Desulfovibrio sp.]
MITLRFSAALLLAALLLAAASPALSQDLSGEWVCQETGAYLLIAPLPPGFNNDYVVNFATDMARATGICLGEGLALLHQDTGQLEVVLDSNVTLSIQVETANEHLVLRIDQDPGPYCGMGATVIGIFKRAP